MAFTGNVIGSIVHGPLALVQKLKEELATEKLRGGTSTVLAAALDKLDQAAVVLAAFQEREAAIQTDANLSDQGKRTKMETTAKEFHAKLAFVEQAANDRREAARQLRGELDALPKVTTDPVVTYLREAEIRAELRKLDQSARMRLLADTVKQQQTTILAAVEHDPLNPDELIPKDYRQRLKDQLLEKSRAEELERWKALVFVAEKLQLLANTLDTTLGRYRIDSPTFPPKTEPRPVDLKSVNQQTPPAKSTSVDVQSKTAGAFA